MDIQQEINFALKEKLEKEKIEFAFPTQVVLVKNNKSLSNAFGKKF